MRTPKPTEQVWLYRRPGGKVTVHRGDESRYTDIDGWVTMCDRPIPYRTDYRWIWLQYRTLNPDFANLCSRCWGRR